MSYDCINAIVRRGGKQLLWLAIECMGGQFRAITDQFGVNLLAAQ